MIRTATPADLPALAALEAELFGADAWTADGLTEVLAGAGRQAWVEADDDTSVSGYAVTGPSGDVVELLRIGVAPAAQRQAVATGLMREVIAAAAAAGADRILIEVSADNTGALAFYDDQGFTEIHRRPRYYRDGSDAIVMQLGE
ncbi:GNAT family N-acetyltransferase [Nocardioides speluncae]|uniref:GNAT family N-acetyltransferase n=1 Tax=Nocardioides speluncae TaxID=2670337 RepID=UPI000D69867B|nr:GNAT family N-acetyltransferase [Nocardioides speluncae]